MKLLRRHKSVLLTLGIYWPVIFWLTHIPVPAIAGQSGMSDKTMHAMAYFVLTFLAWFATSPYEKVRWAKAKVWIVLTVVVWYGAIDEYLQGRVGRSADVRDFIADLFGVTLGLGLLSIFGFWPAVLTASAVFIFVISNMSNLLLLPQLEYCHLNAAFHFTAYTAFTLIWIQYIERHSRWPNRPASKLMYAFAVPVSLLIAVKGTASLFDRQIWWTDIATALFGISSAILIAYAIMKLSGKKK